MENYLSCMRTKDSGFKEGPSSVLMVQGLWIRVQGAGATLAQVEVEARVFMTRCSMLA